MEKIFFILAICIVLKYIISIVFICKKLKEWSYVVEIVFSIIMLSVALNLEFQWYFSILIVIGEYFLNKLLVYINIVLIKKASFRILVWSRNSNQEGKVYYRLKQLYQIEYGKKLKQGSPSMAKQVHERTGIKFDRNGFPKFQSYYNVRLKRSDYKESREYHFYKANKMLYQKLLKSKRVRSMFTKADIKAFKNGETPQNYTWHHHQNRGKMQLVSREIHSLVNHIGGYSIWGNDE